MKKLTKVSTIALILLFIVMIIYTSKPTVVSNNKQDSVQVSNSAKIIDSLNVVDSLNISK